MISVKLAPDLLTLTGIDLLIVIMCGIVDVCTTPCIIYNFQTLMKVLFSVHQSVRALDVNINRHKPAVDMCRYSRYVDINIVIATERVVTSKHL